MIDMTSVREYTHFENLEELDSELMKLSMELNELHKELHTVCNIFDARVTTYYIYI